MPDRMPTFIVIGAARSGTTALHYTLAQHPDVYVSPFKETNFFALGGRDRLDGAALGFPLPGDEQWAHGLSVAVHDIDGYRALFRSAPDGALLGESSPLYLYSPRAVRHIHEHVPKAKLIVVLRQPVDRAYSAFLVKNRQDISAGRISELVDAFERWLAEEASGIERGAGGPLHDMRQGRYAEQLERYFERFDRSQIHVCLYDRLESDGDALVRDLLHFIGADPRVAPNLSLKYNESGVPRSARWDRWLNQGSWLKNAVKTASPRPIAHGLARLQDRVKSANLRAAPALSTELRCRLTEQYYSDDIARLSRMLDIDLSPWSITEPGPEA